MKHHPSYDLIITIYSRGDRLSIARCQQKREGSNLGRFVGVGYEWEMAA